MRSLKKKRKKIRERCPRDKKKRILRKEESSRGWSQLGLPSWRNTRRLSRFLPSLPLYFQSSTFAPLLTTSFLFLSFIPLVFFYLRSCVCVRVFFSLPRPPHPNCVRVTRASFPLLRRQPPTLKFLQSLVPVSTLVLCFSFAGFFRFTLFSLSLSGFTRARATVWLGWRAVCRYLQRSWSEGILNVCGGNLGFDLFFIGEHFRDIYY